MPEKVKWQSDLFPDIILTEEHYQRLRKRLRYVESFRDACEQMELWYEARPEKCKKTKRGWKRALTNWLIKANEFAQDKRDRKQTNNQFHRIKKEQEERRVMTELFGAGSFEGMRMSPKVNRNEQYRCKRCHLIHSPNASCPRR